MLRVSVLLAALAAVLVLPTAAHAQPVVTAAQVNGTWESGPNVLRVRALGDGRLRVAFDGLYRYRLADGTAMANTGAGRGEARVKGITALFSPNGAEEACAIVLTFAAGALDVMQRGTCGFGHNVSAEGHYRRTSRAQPSFDD